MRQEEAEEGETPGAKETAEEEVEARKHLIALYAEKILGISQENVNTTKWPKNTKYLEWDRSIGQRKRNPGTEYPNSEEGGQVQPIPPPNGGLFANAM